MSSQQSNTEQRRDDDWDAYDRRDQRRRATLPRDDERPWQVNRKSMKEIKRRTHKRERREHRTEIRNALTA